MTIEAAIYEARKRIRETKPRHGLYITRNRELFDIPGDDFIFHIWEKDDLQTWAVGFPVFAYVEPTGEVQYYMGGGL